MSLNKVGRVGATSGDIQVIARCAQLLRLFSTTQRSLRVSDVGADVGLQRTTVHRYLSSMANAGLLERDDDGGYRLGPLLVQLGTIALRGLRVLEVAGPHCQALADDANETSVIAVWGGMGPVVARVHEAADRLVNINVRVGSPLPLDAAQSLVFMAFNNDMSLTARLLSQLSETHRRDIAQQIEDTRQSGYAINSQVVQGIRAIAAPVLDGHGQVCATVAVIGTVNSISDDPRSGVLVATLRTAQRLSLDLGWTGGLPFDALLQAAESVS
jgi:DNA-binding IclR family transcriptional regulator